MVWSSKYSSYTLSYVTWHWQRSNPIEGFSFQLIKGPKSYFIDRNFGSKKWTKRGADMMLFLARLHSIDEKLDKLQRVKYSGDVL